MAAQHQTRRPSSSASSSTTRPSSAHPQLRLPLSHHGLPRAPTSPGSSYSSRSQRYEPLSKGRPTTSTSRPQSVSTARSSLAIRTDSRRTSTRRYNDYDDADDDDAAYYSSEEEDDALLRSSSHFFRLSLAASTSNTTTSDAPPSPPMTPFSPGAFPGEGPDDGASTITAAQCCPHCRCSLPAAPSTQAAPPKRFTPHQQQLSALQTHAAAAAAVQRARSMEELPSPIRRMLSTRSVGGARNPYAEQDVVRRGGCEAGDPAIQSGLPVGGDAAMTPPPSSGGSRGSRGASGSFASKFGKKIKEKLGGGVAGEHGAVGPGVGAGRASRRVEYEEMEEVHWTEI
ncbi:hypothetical protein B0J12DRAFT_693762 [Macrophomina phaseolina]|uniref:Uncharacterized protein n=1 Tax=Macrophomina phaseolina TaxID=35725 RepID=A0ABQ8GW02_9PEZI|nr:hypothetical protein B0J12DRAFT_693762 [Macrophomina phaseolina]